MKYDTRPCIICNVPYNPVRVDSRACGKRCRNILTRRESDARKRGEFVPLRRPRIVTSTSKMCTLCEKIKKFTEFGNKAASPDGFNTWCRACANDRSRVWYCDNTERANTNTRAWRLRQRGFTAYELAYRMNEQDNKCVVCLSRFHSSGKRTPVIDHDHATGHTRGIICTLCNTAIGQLGDNETGLQRALEYVRRGSLVSA
jgi:hypothetical protein